MDHRTLQTLLVRWPFHGRNHKALVSVFKRHRAHKEYSSRLTRWQRRLLPFDFDVIYKPGTQMGSTDYLSPDLAFKAPPPKDESSLVIAIIKHLNFNKSLSLLETAPRLPSCSLKQTHENKRGTPNSDISQTTRRPRHSNGEKRKRTKPSIGNYT